MYQNPSFTCHIFDAILSPSLSHLCLAVLEMDEFLPLEPLDNDYNFSLDHNEGVFDLFDFNF